MRQYWLYRPQASFGLPSKTRLKSVLQTTSAVWKIVASISAIAKRDIGEHVCRVTAPQWSGAQHAWRQAKRPGQSGHMDRPPVGCGHLGHELVDADLRVQAHLVVGMKTSAGYTSLCQHFNPPG